jgi:hypothetical protein
VIEKTRLAIVIIDDRIVARTSRASPGVLT